MINFKKNDILISTSESINGVKCAYGFKNISKTLSALIERLDNSTSLEASKCYAKEIIQLKQTLKQMIHVSKWIKSNQKEVEDLSCFYNNEYKRFRRGGIGNDSPYNDFLSTWNIIINDSAAKYEKLSELSDNCDFFAFKLHYCIEMFNFYYYLRERGK